VKAETYEAQDISHREYRVGGRRKGQRSEFRRQKSVEGKQKMEDEKGRGR